MRWIEAAGRLAGAVELQPSDHGARVARLAVRLAEACQLPENERKNLFIAGHLHDVGEIALPHALLAKKGALNPAEWQQVHRHPLIGFHVLRHLPQTENSAYCVRWHHERWDGLGYPDGLAAEEIPLAAQVLHVADSFVTLTTGRPYRQALSTEEAWKLLTDEAGAAFPTNLLDKLEALLPEPPPEDTSPAAEDLLPLGPILEALSLLASARHPFLFAHHRYSARLAGRLAREAGLSEEARQKLEVAAALHDLGLVLVPQRDLRRDTRWMSEHDAHVVLSSEIAQALLPEEPEIARWIRRHHLPAEALEPEEEILAAASRLSLELHLTPRSWSQSILLSHFPEK